MPAGMKYNLTPMPVNKEVARFDTCYRLAGGFNLQDDKLVQGTYLPSVCPIAIDFAKREAKAVKNIRVVELYKQSESKLTIKIAKESLAYVGMFIGDGTNGAEIKAIDKTKAEYDTISIKAKFNTDIAVGAVLFEASDDKGITPLNKANFLNYAATKVEPGASVTAIGQLYEIKESRLATPISQKDKESLGDRFLFV